MKTKTEEMKVDNLKPEPLINLELKHTRHQALMEEQRRRKITARERHRGYGNTKPWHKNKLTPMMLCY